jgi:hypothetical protein
MRSSLLRGQVECAAAHTMSRRLKSYAREQKNRASQNPDMKEVRTMDPDRNFQ